jgi:hypothetical protein
MPKITRISLSFRVDSDAMRQDVYATMRGLEDGIDTAINQAVFSCRNERERLAALAMIERRLIRAMEKARAELLTQ